jgi:CheY-like chemotaxis protein
VDGLTCIKRTYEKQIIGMEMPHMPRVRLIHWNASEAQTYIDQLRSLGHEVIFEEFDPDVLRRLKDNPPDAFIIDLGRLPSQGRDVALAIRMFKGSRRTPIVFVGGRPEKVARVKEKVPDALFASWDQIGDVLGQAIAHPPINPTVPQSLLDGYSGAPLPKKLGIKPDSIVALIGAPDDFEKTLGELPQGVLLQEKATQPCDVTLWFSRTKRDIEKDIRTIAASLGEGILWILWPKKTSGYPSDLNQQFVREAGLAEGMVDFKVCSVDATWSGLCFTRRKKS